MSSFHPGGLRQLQTARKEFLLYEQLLCMQVLSSSSQGFAGKHSLNMTEQEQPQLNAEIAITAIPQLYL